MARHRLTDRFIKSLKPETTQKDYWDTGFLPGASFGVRVSPKGRKSFVLLFRLHGRLKRLTLGPYPTLGLADARLKATQALKNAQSGGSSELTSFDDYAAYYMRFHARRKKKPRSIAEDQRIINTYLAPAWGGRRFTEIRKADVIQLVDSIAYDRGAPIMANRVLALISVIFNFAIKKNQLPEDFPNPCRFVEPPGEEKSRERVLSEAEILALFGDLETRREPTASIYRLLLLTAQRSAEIKAMKWTDINDDLWIIPARRTKNGKEHKVPLSKQALAVIDRLRPFSERHEYIFPSGPSDHIRWLQKMSQRIHKAIEFHFTPHDLRRTAATRMSELGVDDVVIAKILNHSWADRQITSVYNRWSRLPEMREALEHWGAKVDAIVGPHQIASPTTERA